LQRALFEKRRLDRMKLFAARKTFNGGDLLLRDVFGSRDARPLGPPIDQDGARATLALSAAVFGSSQIKILPQYSEKTDLRVRLDRVGTSVDSKIDRSHAIPPNREPLQRSCGRLRK
jgi:hypothetical protein